MAGERYGGIEAEPPTADRHPGLARSIAAARDAIGEGEGNADGDLFSPPWKGGVGGGSILAKVSRAATHPQPLPPREGGQMCPSFGKPSPRFGAFASFVAPAAQAGVAIGIGAEIGRAHD